MGEPVKAAARPVFNRRRILLELLAVGVMCAAVVLVYWNPTPDGMMPLASDYHQLHKLRMRFARNALFGEGHSLPAWYPRELLGAPFWSNIQSFPFIPNRLLLLLAFDPEGRYAYTFGITLSALLAALATYLFARKLRLGLIASSAAGFTFAACGYFSSRVAAGHLPLLEVFFALPLMLWTIESLAQALEQSRSPRPAVLAVGICSFIIMLAGHPQIPIYAMLCGGLYAVWRIGFRRCILALTSMGLGAAMAGFVLVPMAMLVNRSTRVLPLRAPDNDLAMPYRRLLGFFAPWLDGAAPPLQRYFTHPFSNYPNNAYFWDTVCFAGWLPWVGLLALLVLCIIPATRRRLTRPAIFLIFIGVAGLVLSLPEVQHITAQLKGTYLRSPARLLYLTEFALAMALAGAVQAALRTRLPIWLKAAVPVLLVLHAIQLGMFDREFLINKPVPFELESSAVEDILPFVRDGRVAIDMELPLRPLRRADDVGFFDSVMLARPYTFLLEVSLADSSLNIQNLDGSALPQRTLEATGVHYVVTRSPLQLPVMARFPHLIIYDIESPYRRAQFYNLEQTYFAPDALLHEALRDPKIDLRNVLLLPEAQRPSGLTDAPAPGMAQLDYRRPNPDHIECTVDAPRPGYLRLIESWDPGWTVTVDGKPSQVARAYDALLGVLVPPGKHEVRFAYHTPGALAGKAVTLLSMIGLGLLVWLAGYKPQRRQAPAAV
jgi:hypothetical protein